MIDRRRLMAFAAAGIAVLRTAGSTAWARTDPTAELQKQLGDKLVVKGQDNYELLRQFSVWNGRKPKRHPEAIVMAEGPDDVVAGVKLAKARGWKVGVRSGGHSWYGSHLRDGAVQINLARMQEMRIDPAARVAIVSPSTEGQVLNAELQDKHGLMFPSAHGVGIGLGGFCMCGGHGWNSREWGVGAANLLALDVVTADGELIHADEEHNSDWLWAARGAGPGYFGAAVRYYLRLHPMPKSIKASHYEFHGDALEELIGWLNDHCTAFPKTLEVVLLGRPDATGALGLSVNATAFTDSEADSDAQLDRIDACPAMAKATVRRLKFAAQVPWRTEPANDTNPTGYRFTVDNLWTSAPSSTLVPLMRRLFSDFPTPKSYVFVQCWGPVQTPLHNAAYSLQGNLYISANGVYADEADDDRCEAWAVDRIKGLSALSIGGQMNDENMAGDPKPYLSAESAKRLEALRAKHDPQGRFVSFLKAGPKA